ncbi:hypothetical protein NODU109028_00005 [Nocardioides dubius]
MPARPGLDRPEQLPGLRREGQLGVGVLEVLLGELAQQAALVSGGLVDGDLLGQRRERGTSLEPGQDGAGGCLVLDHDRAHHAGLRGAQMTGGRLVGGLELRLRHRLSGRRHLGIELLRSHLPAQLGQHLFLGGPGRGEVLGELLRGAAQGRDQVGEGLLDLGIGDLDPALAGGRVQDLGDGDRLRHLPLEDLERPGIGRHLEPVDRDQRGTALLELVDLDHVVAVLQHDVVVQRGLTHAEPPDGTADHRQQCDDQTDRARAEAALRGVHAALLPSRDRPPAPGNQVSQPDPSQRRQAWQATHTDPRQELCAQAERIATASAKASSASRTGPSGSAASNALASAARPTT